MISIDFECDKKHRFEGFFKDYAAYETQLSGRMIQCPLCESSEVKRLFTGCSIQSRSSLKSDTTSNTPTVVEMLTRIKKYIHENFENVGNSLATTARAMHYGVEEKRNVYGESTPAEIKELSDEGIQLIPLPDVEKIDN